MSTDDSGELTGLEILNHLYALRLEPLPASLTAAHLAPRQPARHLTLANTLYQRILRKVNKHHQQGNRVEIFGADWSREHAEEAAEAHARIIIAAYGDTYALPNKIPAANQEAIETESTRFYFLKLNGEFVGTACLSQQEDNRAELGRSAACKARVGNSIIQDIRILEWMLDETQSNRNHTLFSTLRTAPDREIGEPKPMRGGQGVIKQWKKFPEVYVSGTSPLYFKHGAVEQFTVAQITRASFVDTALFVLDETNQHFIRRWHEHYQFPPVAFSVSGGTILPDSVHTNAPPEDSDIFGLVHADMTFQADGPTLQTEVERCWRAGSPVIQIFVPVDRNSLAIQQQLKSQGFQPFGYEPASRERPAHLLFSKVKEGTKVVPTCWRDENAPHPYWPEKLAGHAEQIESHWF